MYPSLASSSVAEATQGVRYLTSSTKTNRMMQLKVLQQKTLLGTMSCPQWWLMRISQPEAPLFTWALVDRGGGRWVIVADACRT